MAAGYLAIWEGHPQGMMEEGGITLETAGVLDTLDATTTAFEALQVRIAARDMPTGEEYTAAGARIPGLRADILALPQYAAWPAHGEMVGTVPMREYIRPWEAADAVFHILRFTARLRENLLAVGNDLTPQHNYVLDIHDYVRRTFEDGAVFFNT
jgi:hypothetical protein